MDYRKLRVLAVILVVVVVAAVFWVSRQGGAATVAFADMEYTRPDMEAFDQALQTCLTLAAEGKTAEEIVDGIWDFYGAYDDFYTNYALADIRYCCDMTDAYWEAEYSFCLQNTTTVDAGLDTLYYALADSPLRRELEAEEYFGEGYFDSYEGESIWDETFTSLMEQEAALIDRYYSQSGQAQEHGQDPDYYSAYIMPLAQTYVELVELRQQIAAYLEYDSYPQFAYDFSYNRDYTVQQEMALEERIRQELVPLYRELDYSGAVLNYCSERQAFAYVKDCADRMGGTVKKAFERLEKDGLYDIGYSPNKYTTSFETYISNYSAPFVFMCAEQSDYDKLNFAHEFGHFANDYACGGSSAGTDVAEVHSQGMEYLSLCYGKNTDSLVWLKMADCLSTYVEQAALASFERQVYDLTGEDLTVENVQALYLKTCEDFGFEEWVDDPLEFATVSHFFTSPMYIISYVVSNDAAFQIYALEKETAGEGLKVYEACLTSEDSYFLEFLESVGLESPFREDGVAQVGQTLREALFGAQK